MGRPSVRCPLPPGASGAEMRADLAGLGRDIDRAWLMTVGVLVVAIVCLVLVTGLIVIAWYL